MMPLRKNSTTAIMMMLNTTMRKPERSSGTRKPPIQVSLSRKRSSHSELAMNRKDAMMEPDTEPMPPMTTISRIS